MTTPLAPLTWSARAHLAVRDRLAAGHTMAHLDLTTIRRIQALESHLTAPTRFTAHAHRRRRNPLYVKEFPFGQGVRVWWRAGPATPRPLVVFVHGGGFAFGSPARNDWFARRLAAHTGAVIASPRYRLAPDHPHPAALQDVWAAVSALVPLVDPARVVLAGESAGGFLAALTALRWRDESPDWRLRGVVLTYPATDLNLEREPASGPRLAAEDLAAFARAYLGSAHHGVSPIAQNLAGLPPTLIQTADHDPLERDGLAFAQRLELAGVSVEVTRYPGTAHGFLSTPRLAPQAKAAVAEQVQFINRILATPSQ